MLCSLEYWMMDKAEKEKKKAVIMTSDVNPAL
jgi:hypothetical protein